MCQIRISLPLSDAVASHRRSLAACASASRCPSRNSIQKRARASAERLPSPTGSFFAATETGRRDNHLQRRASTIQVRPHEARRPASRVVATGIPFPLARYALSLVGKRRLPIASHQVKLSRQAPPRHGRSQGRDHACPGRTEQAPVVSDPAPNQESAAIAHAAESAADVSAWEPDALASDPAEQGCTRRADDRDVPEPHEIIGIARRGHGTILLPESAPSTRG